MRRATSTLSRHVPTVLAAVLVTALRWWTAHRREVFHVRPDEPGQLAIARFVGRGARWNMFDHSTWRPGYGTLISPTTWFTDDPTTMFRSALGVNAVLGGLACALLAVLAHRLTGTSRLTSALLALVTAAAPGVLFPTNWVWSESLVQVAFLLVVVAALRFADTFALRWGVVLVLGVAVGFATHSRLLPLAVLPVGLVVGGVRRRVLRPSRAVVLLGLLGASLVGVSVFSRYVVDHVWDDPASTNTAGGVIGRLGHLGALGQSLLGQTWYLLVSTVGLVGLGAVALARAAARRDAADRPRTTDARIVLAAVVPLVALSVVFMTDRWRPDQIVYGRYNDAVVGPVVLAGLGTVLAATRRRLLADGVGVIALTAAVGAVLRMTSHDDLQAQPLLRPMVIGIVPYAPGGRLAVGEVTSVAVVVMGVGLAVVAVVRSGRARHAVTLALVAVLLVGAYRRTQPALDGALNAWTGARAVEEVRHTVLPAGVPVRGRFAKDSEVSVGLQRLRASLYEFYLPENPMYVDGRVPDGRETPYVFAPVDDRAMRAAGAELVWRDPEVDIGLWVEAAP